LIFICRIFNDFTDLPLLSYFKNLFNQIMDKTEEIKGFDWHRIFYAEKIPMSYLAEIGVRTVIMFLALILVLKWISKRGVKQLSVFELALLIALGSATGDPMFYHYVPVSYGIVVLIVVIFLYKIITTLAAKSKKLELILEGKPICLLTNGRIDYKNYQKAGLPYDKFFAELRLKNVAQLGQVKKVYLETSGEMSVYMFADEEVCLGLPIYPELIENPLENIDDLDHYACIYCGNIQSINHSKKVCLVCGNNQWLLPHSDKRVH
jgi:uncharacterized membrane protein YcaP (DUF421 family)